MGTGGYCIPLSSQYVLLGSEFKEELSILTQTVSTDERIPMRVARSIINRGAKKVGILGLAYKGDLKVCILSPTLKLAKYLTDNSISVKINDPQYSPEEIKSITGCDTFKYPDGLSEFDTVLVVADHREYGFVPNDMITKYLTNCKLILDNTGIWKDLQFNGPRYYLVGDMNWLS
jgi:UDP-N-acetyl-D-mannosaminuronic acid dehydrogenase